MHEISIFWAMVFCFGCAAALASLERLSTEVPSTDVERLLCLDALAPLLARAARGSVLMTLGLVGQLADAASPLAMPVWVALISLGIITIATFHPTMSELVARLTRVRLCARIAAHAMLGTAVIGVIEAFMNDARAGALLLGASMPLFVASRVSFVLASASNDLLALSGD